MKDTPKDTPFGGLMEREQIVYKRVDELRNNPKNPRKNDEAVKSKIGGDLYGRD